MYGSCAWNFYIAETLGPTAVRAVWTAAEGAGSTLTVLNSALGSYGTSLSDAFEEFAVWSWFTGTRSDGAHFSEGGSWPAVSAERTYSSLPVTGGGPTVAHRPDHLAFNFIHVNNPGGTQDLLSISYDGPAPVTTSNHARVCVKTTGGATSERTVIALDPAGAGSASVTGWNLLSQACLVVVNSSTGTNDMDYTVDAERTTPVEAAVIAAEAEGGVIVRWTLETADGAAGLSVWRATAAGEDFTRLNDELLGLESPGFYLDRDVRPGDELWYTLVATAWDGSESPVGDAVRVRVSGAAGLALSPPMPNPVRDTASFELTVPVDGARVALRVFDLSGRLVATVVDEWMDRGRRTRRWDGRDDAGHPVAAGVYFGALDVDGAVVVQKVTVVR
jgi:hypothetical protein